MFDTIIKELKGFCKNDDTCLFVILVLFGFLLCMFFNRNEGFADLNEVNEKNDNHNFGPKDIGRETQPLGIQVERPDPTNGFGRLSQKVKVAREGQQYSPGGFQQQGGLHTSDSSLPKPWGGEGGYYFIDGPSSFGPDRPMDKEIKGSPEIAPKHVVGINSQDKNDKAIVSDGAKKELELVLFYAPWCGHSKNMLGDYSNVKSQYDGQSMNDVQLSIVEVDMDANPEGAKEYNVEVKGFPTLYTFTEVNGKKVGQPFRPRKESEIIAELQKRTSAF
tara:strand:- start:213 stop:1040 length:828 start_codon:yes stop_codon:yes gene_type:complete